MNQIKDWQWVVIGAVAVIALYTLWPGNAKEEIKKTLTQLESVLEQSKDDENPIQSAAQAKKIKDFFTPKIKVEIDVKYRDSHELFEREKLVSTYTLVRQRLKYFKIEFVDTQIQLPSPDRAEVHTTAKMDFDRDSEGFQVAELQMVLKKDEDRWQIEEVQTIEAIEL